MKELSPRAGAFLPCESHVALRMRIIQRLRSARRWCRWDLWGRFLGPTRGRFFFLLFSLLLYLLPALCCWGLWGRFLGLARGRFFLLLFIPLFYLLLALCCWDLWRCFLGLGRRGFFFIPIPFILLLLLLYLLLAPCFGLLSCALFVAACCLARFHGWLLFSFFLFTFLVPLLMIIFSLLLVCFARVPPAPASPCFTHALRAPAHVPCRGRPAS